MRDHPRSRGVYPGMMCHCAKYGGSSPLARGLLKSVPFPDVTTRIIPARAGFTDIWGVEWRGGLDHPRSRGVYRVMRTRRRRMGGSSPLARGLPVLFWTGAADSGIIPARAGFTAGDLQEDRVELGSSPLARGLRGEAGDLGGECRIIPARAGFTCS